MDKARLPFFLPDDVPTTKFLLSSVSPSAFLLLEDPVSGLLAPELDELAVRQTSSSADISVSFDYFLSLL